MAKLRSVRIQRFKRITDASIDLKDLNVLVGGNNSGKSSIIQALHFSIALLQTIELASNWPETETEAFSTSLNPNQLIYSPSEDVYALGPGGKLLESKDQATSFDFTLTSGEACSVTVRKGRNRNIVAAVNHISVAKQLSSLDKPFSVFSPGLAGISKRENHVSDGVLFRMLARGDANLVLRNILLRLWGTERWDNFVGDLRDVFPNLEIAISFNESIDEFIDVKITTGKNWVPLEIAGTGVLQATQILSYIHRFEPSIVVLDEPDSHLHPNNQRILCGLLRRVSEDKGTQVLLTTHSRHVIDAVGAASGFLWVRDGAVDVAQPDDEIGVLLEIGALDVKERAGQPSTRAIVLTEDEITRPLEIILTSSGFDLSTTAVLPYYGVTGIKQLRPLVNVISGINPKAKIVLHRDLDFLTDDEAEKWKTEVRALGVEPFVTRGRDVESHFIESKYLAERNSGVAESEFDEMIETVVTKMQSQIIADYVNGRIDIARKDKTAGLLNAGTLAVEAPKVISADVRRYCGKTVLRALRSEYQNRHKSNMGSLEASERLRDPLLTSVAKKAFKTNA